MLKGFMWYDDMKDAEEMMTEQQQQQAAGEKQGPAPVAVAMLDEVLLLLLLLLLHPFNGLLSRITWVSRYQNGTRSSAITEVPNTHSSLD